MATGESDRVLRGRPVPDVPRCSLAEYLVPRLRALPRDHVLQVEADTGAAQTAGELLSRSVRLSEGLRRMGVGEDDVVGMLCRNSIAAGEIVLATWLSGAAVAPVDGFLKPAEMQHMMALTRPKVVFAEEAALPVLEAALEVLSLDATVVLAADTQGSRTRRKTLRDVLVDVDVDAYRPRPVKSPDDQVVGILPSSGTSGLQKGVCITHRNFVFQDINMELCGAFTSSDILQISNFYWVTGMLTFLRCVSKGMKRVLLRTSAPSDMLRAIEEHKPSSTLVAPLGLLALVNDPEFDRHDLSSMKHVFVGGSAFTPSIAERVQAKWSGIRITQGYGTTEVSGCISVTDGSGDPFSMGRVTPGVKVKVVDLETGELLPANAHGELCVMSPGIAKGYLRNEEATRESLDPQGWARTGDLGYYDDSGQLYLVERIKEMIKVMNMQISPVEVESAILSMPGVLEAGVAGATVDGSQLELLALVVKEKDSPLTGDQVAAHVAGTLSDYKRLTGGVHFVDSLPMTASGKLRRSELKKMAQDLYSRSRGPP